MINKLFKIICDQFSPMQDTELYTYYHLLLENNDEERFGILTEIQNEIKYYY
jgi:hypothetical protein